MQSEIEDLTGTVLVQLQMSVKKPLSFYGFKLEVVQSLVQKTDLSGKEGCEEYSNC